MKKSLKMTVAVTTLTLMSQAMAQITLYEHDGWRGRALTTSAAVADFTRAGFNDRASSVVVSSGRWEVCDGAHFSGRCMVLRAGSYESLAGMGMNDRISSVRPMRREHYDNAAPEPLPQATYEYRRRPNEAVFEARVTSVHAVVGADQQRCWVEREQVDEPRRNNVGGAVAGALIGGVLGHQVGAGMGRDAATAGGAVAGAAIGANAGNGGSNNYSRDVRRCENKPSAAPEYWDVTYNFSGQEHRIQMASAPGPTILVNRHGDPRQ